MVFEVPANLFDRYRQLQSYADWTELDAARVVAARETLVEEFAAIIGDFYQTIQRFPLAARALTGGPEQIGRLQGTLRLWLDELFCGRYDEAYVARRWRVGLRHADIGLDQVYTNLALSRVRQRLLRRLREVRACGEHDSREVAVSLGKLLDLDLAIIEDAYQAAYAERLQRTARLAAIGQIGAGIAHELRNPLNVIQTSVYYLLHTRSPSAEKTVEHLRRIERQVGTANSVITALSDFARLPAPQWAVVNLASCVRDAAEETGLTPETLRIEIPDDLVLPGDQGQLRIVLGNLLRNAREAIAAGGSVTVQGTRDEGQVRVTIADTGCGISPENLRRVAEPLFTTKARGLGLGLAISKAIVEKHGGTWIVASEPGQGTTFTLSFPESAGSVSASQT